ncbi:MAG: hypothetical protein RR186_01030, partial [Raoultibacter sp.]
ATVKVARVTVGDLAMVKDMSMLTATVSATTQGKVADAATVPVKDTWMLTITACATMQGKVADVAMAMVADADIAPSNE